jgi:hypothetical protein
MHLARDYRAPNCSFLGGFGIFLSVWMVYGGSCMGAASCGGPCVVGASCQPGPSGDIQLTTEGRMCGSLLQFAGPAGHSSSLLIPTLGGVALVGHPKRAVIRVRKRHAGRSLRPALLPSFLQSHTPLTGAAVSSPTCPCRCWWRRSCPLWRRSCTLSAAKAAGELFLPGFTAVFSSILRSLHGGTPPSARSCALPAWSAHFPLVGYGSLIIIISK